MDPLSNSAMRIGIVIDSRFGQTEKIAHTLKEALKERGHATEVFELRKDKLPGFVFEDWDALIIGGPVYVSHFPRALVKWVHMHQGAINSKPCGFFSVSLNAADSRPEAREVDDRLLKAFLDQSGLSAQFVASFAGAIQYRKYNFLIRYLMKRISASAGGPTDTSKNHELTDWRVVTEFAEAFSSQDRRSSYVSERRLMEKENRIQR